MKEGIKFYFDGISSDDLGLYNCTMSDGLYDEPFLAERQIHEVQVRGRDEPYFQGVTRSPLSFSLTFAFKDTWDEEKIRYVARVLDQSTYKPFYTEANPERIFYVMLVSSSRLLHNGLNSGYCELEFRCNSPYSYTPIYTSEVYDLSNNNSSTPIEFINKGDKNVYPEIFITKIGDDNGDISIVNQSNAGLEFKFTTAKKAQGTLTIFSNVADGETITIDNQTYEFDNNTTITTGNIPVDVAGDLTSTNAINKLTTIINSNPNSNVTAIGDTSTKTIIVKYKSSGVQGNSIATTETCLNAAWDHPTLTGGIDGLVDDETVYVDCENEDIETDLSNTYRFDQFNNGYMEFIRGVNRLNIAGKCKLWFKYRFQTLQG